MLKDSFNRVHNYLRISLTDHCNLRCFYCIPEEGYLFSKQDQLMTAEEIITLSSVFVRLGVDKIRLTGGEPLVRKDFPIIYEKLSALPVNLHLTTNGILIHEHLNLLKKFGCRSINLSLDTLNADTFLLLTRRNQFQQVYDNMLSLVNSGFNVKVNVVVMKGINEHEINRFIGLTKFMPVDIRFIEFMPFEGNYWVAAKVFTLSEILATIQTEFNFEALPHEKNETAKRFKINGHRGTFSIISTMSAPFCGDCNRIRLTADGKLKNCLFSKSETDLRTPLREGKPVDELIRDCILQKSKMLGGQINVHYESLSAEEIKNRSMISIGG
ncbi:MAG: GTP 3',8-cyclase MoaA [Bacteroidetes bacterium]|nr:GTP 3',8-cyclase MoaA [Bacteroidota bacterium]